MSTYREIIGKKIKNVSSDPSAGVDGEMWYNSTTGTFRGPAKLSAWTSGSPISHFRFATGGAGTQTAALLFGGYGGPGGGGVLAYTEEYDGSGWTSTGDMNNARVYMCGMGTQTAALAGGGEPVPFIQKTEEYNGSTWSEVNTNPTPFKYQFTGTGTQTAGLSIMGYQQPSGTVTNACFEYDGTNWAAGGSGNTARMSGGGAGTQTATIAGGGNKPPANAAMADTETYNGTAWTTEPPGLNTSIGRVTSAFGTQTDAFIAGGATGPGSTSNSAVVQGYDGSSWTAKTSLATARRFGSGATNGTTSAGLVMGGYSTTWLGNSEEWNVSTSVTTPGAWASSGNMNTARSQIAGMGITTAAVAAGGLIYGPGAYQSVAEEYDGSTWTNIPSMPVTLGFRSGAGTATAGLAIAGHDGTASPTSSSEWNGSTWGAGGNLNAGGIGSSGGGTQTAAWLAGSGEPPLRPNTATEEYNGSAWTSVPGALNTGRGYSGGSGPQTDGSFLGGGTPSPAYNNTEEYNGTAWTNSNTLAVPMSMMANSGGSAPSNSIMAAGSANISTSATTQQTDGSTWYTSAALSTARGTQRACGAGANADSSLCAGGNSPSINATEEFSAGSTSTNIEDFATS